MAEEVETFFEETHLVRVKMRVVRVVLLSTMRIPPSLKCRQVGPDVAQPSANPSFWR